MPFRELRLYMNNYDVIIAEENLNQMAVIAAGTGSMKPEDQQELTEKWFSAVERKRPEQQQSQPEVAQERRRKNPFEGMTPDEIGAVLEKSPRWRRVSAPQQPNPGYPISPPGSGGVQGLSP